ncbi:chemotaxis protein CheW [bacterium]|nr:chemotaxis protein CheW [bacterium]
MSVESIHNTQQYLTFSLDQELYALDITQVQSVLDFEKVTKVPRTPEFMRGVINLRGSVVPITDLKQKFGMGMTEQTVDSCIIIVEVLVDDEVTVLGALADSVQEVIDLDPENIEPAPKIGTRLNTEFIKGMGKRGDNFIILLDLEKIFSVDELQMAQNMSDVPIEEGKAVSVKKTSKPSAKKKKMMAEEVV